MVEVQVYYVRPTEMALKDTVAKDSYAVFENRQEAMRDITETTGI